MPQEMFVEVGRTGLKQWGGYVAEEFLADLQGPRAIKTFREMSENDPVIGAIMFAIKMLIRQASWRVEPSSASAQDQEAADFLDSCLHDMETSWADVLTEILSFLVYGWSFHELVYKRRGGDVRDPIRRSRYTDGRIGWRKLPIRAQDTLAQWEFDEAGTVVAMVQTPPPDYSRRVIPMEKAVLFRTEVHKDNPQGRSILRNAYRPWYFKKRLEEIEAQGIERELCGLPVLTPPDQVNIWDKNDPVMVALKNEADSVIENLQADRTKGLVKPFGWELELLSTGGRRQIDVGAVVNRYDQRIAMTVLADFILLGHEKVGSFALSSSKTEIFAVALGAWLDSIAAVFNEQAIPRLFALNGFRLDAPPQLVHGDIESPDLDQLGTFIKELTGVGAITPGPALEDYLREAANLPQEELDQEAI